MLFVQYCVAVLATDCTHTHTIQKYWASGVNEPPTPPTTLSIIGSTVPHIEVLLLSWQFWNKFCNYSIYIMTYKSIYLSDD